MKKNSVWAWTLVIISVSLVLSCSKDSSSYGSNNNNNNGGGSGTGNTISMYGMAFSPASKTVAKGTVVKWVNNDSYAHTVTSDDGVSFSSGNIAGGKSYSYTANTPGTFNYHCTIHSGMTGTLIVSP